MAKSTASSVPSATPASPLETGSGGLRIVWIALLALFAYLLLYGATATPKDKDDNEIEVPESPAFDLSAWFSGVYQDKVETHLKDNSAIGKELIPLKNQIDYEVFHKLNLNDYIMGKDNWLVATSNIDAYYGRDYMGDSAISERLRKVKVLQDTLQRKGIDILLIYVPNKEQVFPEHIPDAYHKYTRHKTNIETYAAKSQEYGLHYINFLPFFQQLKPISKYPLYPQYGSHWSYYSECLAADTVIKYIAHLKQMELPRITWDKVSYPENPKVRDGDAMARCGLLDPPIGFGMAYPQIQYTGSAMARPVKTLGIGDSYYRGFLYLGVMETVFDKGELWYYYNSVVPESKPLKEVWEYDLKSKIEEHKMIIILSNNASLPSMGSGFIEDAYELYTNPKAYAARVLRERPVRQHKKEIHNSPELLDEALKLSKDRGITLDSAITLKAHDM